MSARFFPSADLRFAVELVRITAEEAADWSLSAPAEAVHAYGRGTKGVYLSKIYHSAPDVMPLPAGESVEFAIFYTAVIANETLSLPDGRASWKSGWRASQSSATARLSSERATPSWTR